MSVGEGLRNILPLDQVGTCCREVVDWGMLLCGLGVGAGKRTISLLNLEERTPGGLSLPEKG